jgi:hypothetical protein
MFNETTLAKLEFALMLKLKTIIIRLLEQSQNSI